MPERELHTGARTTVRGHSRGGVVLFTPKEAGERLRCSENHVYRLIARGLLQAVDIAQPESRKSKTRIRSDDLAAFIDMCTRTTRTA